jgi:hypothetical protein
VLSCQSGVWKRSGGADGLGYGQTWQNLTGNSVGCNGPRNFFVTCTNTTGKPIFVSVATYKSSGGGGNVMHSVNGVQQLHEGMAGTDNGKTITFVVPPDSTYSVATDSSYFISSWHELR